MNDNDQQILTQTSCPLCGRTVLLKWQADNIPFFGDVMYMSVQCECGFRYADTMILDQRDPVRYSLKVESVDDLNARVIRSTSGTIRIPEMGIDIEPGPASESYISNVEGVLCRIREVVGMVSRWEDEPQSTIDRAYELLDQLEQVMRGEKEITLIIEDPMGNSAIASEKVCSEILNPEEAASLKTGAVVFEKTDLGLEN